MSHKNKTGLALWIERMDVQLAKIEAKQISHNAKSSKSFAQIGELIVKAYYKEQNAEGS